MKLFRVLPMLDESAEPVGRVQLLPFHDIGKLHGHAVLVTIVLVLQIEADIEVVVGAHNRTGGRA